MKKNSSKPSTKKYTKLRFFNSLPDDNKDLLLSYLDERTTAIISSVNKELNNQTKELYYWEDKFIVAGCDKELFQKLKQLEDKSQHSAQEEKSKSDPRLIKNYKHLYHVFMSINYSHRIQIKELWELLCLSGELSAIQYAIKHGLITAETKNNDDENALLCVANSGNEKSMALIAKTFPEIDPRGTNKMGENTFLICANIGSITGMKKSLDDFGISSKSQTHEKINALHQAFRSCKLDAIDYVHDKLGINPRALTSLKESILHFAARSGSIPVLKRAMTLLNINFKSLTTISRKKLFAKDENGEDILHHAVRSSNLAMVKFVLSLGIDIKSTNKAGLNVLHLAAQENEIGLLIFLAEELAKYGIEADSLDSRGYNVLHWAIARGQINTAKYALEIFNIDPAYPTYDSTTILQLAVLSGHKPTVEFVFKINIDYKLELTPECTDNKGNDAYHYANKSLNKDEMVEALRGMLVAQPIDAGQSIRPR